MPKTKSLFLYCLWVGQRRKVFQEPWLLFLSQVASRRLRVLGSKCGARWLVQILSKAPPTSARPSLSQASMNQICRPWRRSQRLSECHLVSVEGQSQAQGVLHLLVTVLFVGVRVYPFPCWPPGFQATGQSWAFPGFSLKSQSDWLCHRAQSPDLKEAILLHVTLKNNAIWLICMLGNYSVLLVEENGPCLWGVYNAVMKNRN